MSRDLAHALEQALAAEPGTMVPAGGLPGPGPRLQDLLDLDAPLEPTLHPDFGFWLEDGAGERSAEVQASMERANAAVVPTTRLPGVDAAYWCRMGERAHLRWVLPYDEDTLLDALARLAAAAELSLGENTRYAGSFRAHGLLVPVWDLPWASRRRAGRRRPPPSPTGWPRSSASPTRSPRPSAAPATASAAASSPSGEEDCRADTAWSAKPSGSSSMVRSPLINATSAADGRPGPWGARPPRRHLNTMPYSETSRPSAGAEVRASSCSPNRSSPVTSATA